jgi:hypothetical protein
MTVIGREIDLCIGLPKEPARLYSEMAEMLIDEFGRSSFRVTIVHDGDRRALSADMLLLVGDCLVFQQYPEMLSSMNGPRPITALWLHDSLPPATFNRRATAISSRLALYDQSRLMLRSHMRGVVEAIPLPIRKKLGVGACAVLLNGLDRELGSIAHERLKDLDVNSRYEVLGRSGWIESNWAAGWLDQIYVGTVPRMSFLSGIGIPSKFIPIGYNRRMGEDLGVIRDVDVAFVGEIEYGRRGRIIEYIQHALASRGIRLTVIRGDCYGRARDQLLSRAKISLNIPRFPWDHPGIRLLMCMACGSMVVSEEMDSVRPFVAGKHLVIASVERLADTIAYYLKNEDERLAVTTAAKEFIHRDLTMTDALAEMLAPMGGAFGVSSWRDEARVAVGEK